MSERIQILEMVAKGIITPAEADELLTIMETYDGHKTYDKTTLLKVKDVLTNALKKIEDFGKKTGQSIKNSEGYQSLQNDFELLNEKLSKTLRSVENKLKTICGRSFKETCADIGRGFKRFGKKVGSVFKKNDKPKEEKVEYIDLNISEQENDENK